MKTWVIDTETNALHNYTKLHNVVFRNVDTNAVMVFRSVEESAHTQAAVRRFLSNHVETLIGHNIINFDCGVMTHFGLWGPDYRDHIKLIDTLVVSRLLNFNLETGHSLDSWGTYFKINKSNFNDFSKWSKELEDRCIIDTEINLKLYNLFKKYIDSPKWKEAIELEHLTSTLCHTIYTNGITFDYPKSISLYNTLNSKVRELRESFAKVFLPKSTLVREVIPKLTSKGVISSSNLRFAKNDEGILDLSVFTPDAPFSLFEYEVFNPDSPQQRIKRLNEAGWKPVNKTKGHIAALRDKTTPPERLAKFKEQGWVTDEENLSTLPDTAPDAIKKLKDYLVLSSRLGDVKEWINLIEAQQGVLEPGPVLPQYEEQEGVPRPLRMALNGILPRLHGSYMPIGAWSHRASHQKPNMANIPALLDKQGKPQVYGGECRELFTVPPDCKQVGVDAEGIQLRIFAHLCQDERLIKAIEEGKKELGTDIHTLNKNILGSICASRDTAKTFIYALLLGAGLAKLASILQCSLQDATLGMKRILDFYPGWRKLLEGRLRYEGEKGYIIGLDGRALKLPEPRLALTGHLQSGEKIVMVKSAQNWLDYLKKYEGYYKLVNWVHDEYQTEVRNITLLDNVLLPELVGQEQVKGIEEAGRQLGMAIKLTGNYKIGNNWKDTH